MALRVAGSNAAEPRAFSSEDELTPGLFTPQDVRPASSSASLLLGPLARPLPWGEGVGFVRARAACSRFEEKGPA